MSKWIRSSRCDSRDCTEVALGSAGVAVRDSTIPDVSLTFGAADWRRFLAHLRAGRLERG